MPNDNQKNLYDLRTGSEKLKEIELALAYIQDVVVAISNLAISGDIISDVHDHLAEIDICANNITEIVTVADNIVDVNTVATNIANVNTCATSILNINAVGDNIANVNIVAGLEDNINALALIASDITTVANISTDVTEVASISADIQAVNTDPLKTAIIDNNTEPQKTAILNAGANATKAELEAWEAEAEKMTAESQASEPVGVLSKTYTSNGNGTFSSVNNLFYSALHYSQSATSGGTERTSARNTAISSSASGVLALATTPTQSFATRTYIGNGTSQDIPMGIGDGTELITNGTFDTDVTGWLSGNGALLTWQSGVARVNNTTANYGYIAQAITTVIGTAYEVSIDMPSKSGSAGNFYAWMANTEYGTAISELANNDASTSGIFKTGFIATSTTTYINARTGNISGQYFDVDNVTVKEITSPIKSYDPNWVSGRAYLLANEQDAYCIHNYYIYKLLADVTSATTPDADPTNWEQQADGVSVPWFNSQVWIKSRTEGTTAYIGNQCVFDTLRGETEEIRTDLTAVETTQATSLTSFNADGFSVGSLQRVNDSGDAFVAWQEQFDSMVSGTTNHGKRYITAYNAQSGEFIGIMVGSGTAGHEIPHGVGTKPDIGFIKDRDTVVNWVSPLFNMTDGDYMNLNLNNALVNNTTVWSSSNDTTFTLGDSVAVNALNKNIVFYGSSNRDNHTVTKMYQGTGAAGNVVDLGLDMTQAGAKVMLKVLTGATGSWSLVDNVRGGTNYLRADNSGAELADGNTSLEFTSTGVIINSTHSQSNTAGYTYLIEATVPNYDKPNGGLDIPAGTVISYAEGTDNTDPNSSTGDLDTPLPSLLVSDITMVADEKNYIYSNKDRTAGTTTVKLLKGLDRISADKWGVESPSDATLKTTDKHSDYASATGVVSVSGESSGFEIYKAFDKSNANFWVTTTTTADLTYNMSEARVLKSYEITGYLGNLPKSPSTWTIEGSNDGVNWTVVDTQTSITFTSAPILFIASNAVAYKYYKMDITANQGHVSDVGLYELELNTEHPSGDFYDVAEGILYDSTDTAKSRVYLGEVIADGEGLVIPDTLIEYPVAHQDVTSLDVYDKAKFHSDIEGKQICTAWVNFDGTTTPPAIIDSYNVTDVVRTSTGQFDVYFVTDMKDTNYSMVGSGGQIIIVGNNGKYINKVTVFTGTTAASLGNYSADISIFGGKA